MTDQATSAAAGTSLTGAPAPANRRRIGGFGRLPSAGRDTPPQGDEHGMSGEAKTQLRIVAGRFVHDIRAMSALIVFILVALSSVLVTTFWHYGYSQETSDFARVTVRLGANGSVTTGKILGGPSLKHPFGVDSVGHDMLAQVMQGTKTEILTALLVAVISTAIGTALGAIAGFYSGLADTILMRFTDIVLAVPLLVVLVVLANRFAAQASGWLPVALVIAFLAWTYLARLVRADFLSLRERDFVEAARAIGSGNRRIIVRHLVPNAIGPIIVNGTLTVANAIVLESTLSFLGLGIQPPDVSLGQLVADGQNYAQNEWWLFAFPAIFIVVMILCVNFIGDGLRSAFDPHGQRVRA